MQVKNKTYAYLAIYFTVNLLFLTSFPFIHSDEPWLSGLTRAFINTRSISATEPFFKMYPRNPHAIKTLFHMIQIPFVSMLGYNIFAVRLISLLFSLAALVLVYTVTRDLTDQPQTAFMATIAVSLDIQFIYASHMARQEIIIMTAMLASFYMLQKGRITYAAIITGVSIGIHPNAFLVASLCGAVINKNWRGLLLYTAITASFCAAFVTLSFILDSNFLTNYAAYGQNFGVDTSLWEKLKELVPYFTKLYGGISGTYYIPDIRPQLALLIPVVLISVIIKRPITAQLSATAAVLGILAGIALVGRFSQLYIVFIFPFVYILFARLHGAKKTMLLGIAVAAVTVIQLADVLPKTYGKYDSYLLEISKHIPPNETTLANLNTEYYFDYGALIDYRNLSYMREHGYSFADFIYEYGIRYIILSDEMDLIYRSRPSLNAIYGNLYYYEEMLAFIEKNCSLAHSFTDSLYGMRLVGYQELVDCNIKIFKVMN